jgi:purine-binding chemotaxis protein CheW
MAEPQSDRAGPAGARRFLTFRVEERFYALPAEDVVEVMRVPPMTRVPQSPPALLGIANLRGDVLPVASLRGLLGLPDASIQPTSRAIVLDVGAHVAIVVDQVESLVEIASQRIEERHAELGAAPGERLKGSFQVEGGEGAAKILDIKGLLDAAFAQRSRSDRRIRRTGGAEEANAAESVSANAEMLVTFEVAGQEFALALESVQEVVPAPAARTAVPRADAMVLGVTSFRGALLPLLSLRALLGFPLAAAQNGREKVVVMNIGDAQVGLVADRARAIVAADPALVDPVPKVLAARVGGESRLRAIYRGDSGRRLISILAPEQLFREDVMQRLGEARANQAKAPEAESARREELDFLVFRLGDDEFALPIDAVDEVARVPAKITRVPKTPKFLEGVVNLRGAVLPVIDQRRRFDMPKSETPDARRLVVVRTQSHRAGLIVDSVSDVLRIPADSVEPAPELTDEIGRLVRGVINLEQSGRMVLLLDPPELLTRAERGLLEAFQAETAQANA